MRSSTGFSPRKLIAPLIIIGVAIGLGMWGSQSGTARNDAVERFVRMLIAKVAEGEDADVLLARTDPTVAASLRRQLEIVADAHGDQVDFIDVDVFAGDVSPHPGSQTATHSVLIGDQSVPMLGLRIFCDDPNTVRILGWWNPQAR